MRHYRVDRILAMETGKSAVGVKAVGLSEDVFNEHFPGNPVYPGVYLIEGLAQTAGYLLDDGSEPRRIAIMASVDRVRFHRFVRPGQVITFEVRIVQASERTARVRGLVTREGSRVAEAQITFRMLPAESVIPGDYRVFWESSRRILAGAHPGEPS